MTRWRADWKSPRDRFWFYVCMMWGVIVLFLIVTQR